MRISRPVPKSKKSDIKFTVTPDVKVTQMIIKEKLNYMDTVGLKEDPVVGNPENDPEVLARLSWIQDEDMNLDKAHYLFVDDKNCAVFIPLEKYTCVPTECHKYVIVTYPEIKRGYAYSGSKIYIARKEKAREMWAGFIDRFPYAKKVDDLCIAQTGGITPNIRDADINISRGWKNTIMAEFRLRMTKFLTTERTTLAKRWKS